MRFIFSSLNSSLLISGKYHRLNSQEVFLPISSSQSVPTDVGQFRIPSIAKFLQVPRDEVKPQELRPIQHFPGCKEGGGQQGLLAKPEKAEDEGAFRKWGESTEAKVPGKVSRGSGLPKKKEQEDLLQEDRRWQRRSRGSPKFQTAEFL